jgi:hypothetical protein
MADNASAFTKLMAVIIASLVAIATATSDKIVAKAKDAMNRADSRRAKYDSITEGLSGYIFETENLLDILASGKADKDAVKGPIDAYNDAYTTARKNEYSNVAIVKRMWGADTGQKYRDTLTAIATFDGSNIHPFNAKVIPVYTGKSTEPVVIDSADLKRAQSALNPLKQQVEIVADALLEPPSSWWQFWR